MTDLTACRDLKPCPFCGNRNDFEGSPWPNGQEAQPRSWIVRCGNPNCNAEVAGHTPEEAVGLWNTRTPEGEAVAWMHVMHCERGQKMVRLSQDANHPFGIAGRDYSPEYAITSQPLYTHPSRATAVEDAMDAARYRWLREGKPRTYNVIMIYAGNALDKAIDAALAQRGESKP